ncbi:hypothetical protein NDU88_000577 [Pleurodeles waltl]|uniref:Uncharacterized protein n=1 Tax=Pleurodeles waltl TaxID=8319 RepID=A0AAV7WLS6_PLEWA|nr:hypothetical protein NDU88_000577 [Pleurodeles waltl]
MARILAVAYPELDGRLEASEQQRGPVASSGGGAEALATEGAGSHKTQEAVSTDGEGTSGTEGEGEPRQRVEETVRTQMPPLLEAPW